MVSPLWSQPEIHCGAATSWRLPSAWSALWWYGTQLFCPPLRHKHVCVTHSHITSEILYTLRATSWRLNQLLLDSTQDVQPPLGWHTRHNEPLVFCIKPGQWQKIRIYRAWHRNMVLLEETSSSHIQIRALSLLTCWHVCCRGFSFFFVLFSLQATCKILRQIVLKENVPFIMTVGFKDFFPTQCSLPVRKMCSVKNSCVIL